MYKLLNFLSKSNLFIAIAASSIVIGAFAYFDLEVDFSLCAFVFFSALFTYNFQRRIGDLKEDRRFTGTEWIMMAIGIPGMIFFGIGLEISKLVILALAGMLSILYATPVISIKGKSLSLRQVPYIKLWIIVLVWMVVSSLVPLIGSINKEGLILYSLQQALFIAALTLPFDIRDVELDEPEQRTIPQVFGLSATKNLAFAFLALSAFAGGWLVYSELVDQSSWLAHMVSLSVSALLISRVHADSDDLFYTIGLDGMLILQGFLIFFS